MMNPTLPATLSLLEGIALDRTSDFITRFMPDCRIPPVLAGFPTNRADAVPLIKVLAWLGKQGHPRVAGLPVTDAIQTLLRQIDGPPMETFNSFNLSELLLSHGPFEGNPLLAGLTIDEKANVAAGCDSSHIRMQGGKPLGGRPNNYWGVLARCEAGRLNLGLTGDRTLFDECLGRVKAVAFQNEVGYFDDHKEMAGRYDIYSADVLLFLRPLWGEIRNDAVAGRKLDLMVRKMDGLVESIALEGGVSWAWGRTLTGHSQAMLLEWLAMNLADGTASDPARSVHLLHEATHVLAGLFEDGYTSVQRRLGIERYRMAWRLFETTFDLIGKFCFAHDELSKSNGAGFGVPCMVPHPPRDVFIPFDKEQAGVWMFRNEHMAFQLPVVAFNDSASYLPFPHHPGRFENPCDNFSLAGAPRVLWSGRQYTTGGRPMQVEKIPGGLSLTYGPWQAADLVPYGGPYTAFLPSPKSNENLFPGTRRVKFQVVGKDLVVDEAWTFDRVPDAIQLDFAESGCPFTVSIEGAKPGHASVMAVDGIFDWRTPFGSIRKLHQFSFAGAAAVAFQYRIHFA